MSNLGWPVKVVAKGGIPVTEAANGLGTPCVEADNGVAVTFVESGGYPLTTGARWLDLYPGALFAIDWSHRFFAEGGQRRHSYRAIAGMIAVGVQDITRDGLMIDGSGQAYISDPPLPAGDWTIVFQAMSSVVNFSAMIALNRNTLDDEFQFYNYSDGARVNGKLVAGAAAVFEGNADSSALSSPIRVAVTKNGTAVRVSCNGQDAVALGTWSPITPTRLFLGAHGDGTVDRINARFSTLAMYAGGWTDEQIKLESTGWAYIRGAIEPLGTSGQQIAAADAKATELGVSLRLP